MPRQGSEQERNILLLDIIEEVVNSDDTPEEKIKQLSPLFDADIAITILDLSAVKNDKNVKAVVLQGEITIDSLAQVIFTIGASPDDLYALAKQFGFSADAVSEHAKKMIIQLASMIKVGNA